MQKTQEQAKKLEEVLDRKIREFEALTAEEKAPLENAMQQLKERRVQREAEFKLAYAKLNEEVEARFQDLKAHDELNGGTDCFNFL